MGRRPAISGPARPVQSNSRRRILHEELHAAAASLPPSVLHSRQDSAAGTHTPQLPRALAIHHRRRRFPRARRRRRPRVNARGNEPAALDPSPPGGWRRHLLLSRAKPPPGSRPGWGTTATGSAADPPPHLRAAPSKKHPCNNTQLLDLCLH
jgi:hypothetical protein